MREDLLGYLLNALDEAERRRVFESLQKDPQLRQELESLRRDLRPLDATNRDYEPPAGLAELTCELVEGYAEQHAVGVPQSPLPRRSGRWQGRFGAREACVPAHGWSAADMIVVAGILLAISLIFFPAMARSRYLAQVAYCQENLRQLGIALASYSEQHDGFFPRIPVSGNRAVAGIYAPLLFESQYLDNPRIVLCPGSELAARGSEFRIPFLAELDQADGLRLQTLQRLIGGSYGYTLGSLGGDGYVTPRNRLRQHFALLADAPSLHLAGRQSGNHGGRGQNVLFEDLHVEFLPSPRNDAIGDDLFRNRYGYVEAGLDEGDSVVAPSNVGPLLQY
ncbi:MAG: hypothetical protein GX575_21230 [Candidatus Anammoximicrobium sp.]|nr:hypothetical protein [Candidatus Anammoximicrobium sp.]